MAPSRGAKRKRAAGRAPIAVGELLTAYAQVLARAVERHAMTVEEAEPHYERVVRFRRDLEAGWNSARPDVERNRSHPRR